jgi:hypothetical protein
MGCSKIPESKEVKDEDWGRYSLLEDVWIDKQEGYEDWEPHVQACKHEDGDLSLRFCYWKRKEDGTKGVFVRSPMFVYDRTLEMLRDEAKKHKADIILMLFKKLGE